MILRPYQSDLSNDIDAEWAAGAQVVLGVLPTAGGKTILFSDKLQREPGVSFAVAHRQELVAQMSMALAKFGVKHSLQVPKKVLTWIVSLHVRTFGQSFSDPRARCICGGVRTIKNRASLLSNAVNQAKLWIIDEGHHPLRGNEWGDLIDIFPRDDCKGLLVTATPERSDGRGLGRHADGYADAMVVGPHGRELINMGYLSDYKIYAPETHIDLSDVKTGSTGDWVRPGLVAATRKSKIVGDVVEHYIRHAAGKLGVTFVTDIQSAHDTADAFNAAGVPAAVLHAKTPPQERQGINERFERAEIKEIVNVDILGEGYDCPAMEVASFARSTQSYGLYVQQFGRPLRIMPGKSRAIILDHVGNVMRFAATRGLPDAVQTWTLDSRDKRSRSERDPDLLPMQVCTTCTGVWEGYNKTCPYCGQTRKPETRATIEQVDGDLTELDPAALAAMRGERNRIDAPESTIGDRLTYAGAQGIAIAGAMKQHRIRSEAQEGLRSTIAMWAGYQVADGVPDDMSYRIFYRKFGIDVMAAQILGRKDAESLTERVTCDILGGA